MLSTDNLSRDYHTVVVGATDVQGRLFGRRIPVRRFLQNAQKDVPICTCALAWDITEDLGLDVSFAGLHTGWHDFGIRPVLETLRPYPGVAGTAICMADIVDEEGQLLEIAPRTILRRQLERTRGWGTRSCWPPSSNSTCSGGTRGKRGSGAFGAWSQQPW
jgi:glutamine synthetase